MRAALDVMQQSAAFLSLVLPSRENRLAWQEFKNKLQSFNLFERVDEVCGPLSGIAGRLPELVKRADALGPYIFVWAK
jgi:hypothetical protein